MKVSSNVLKPKYLVYISLHQMDDSIMDTGFYENKYVVKLSIPVEALSL